MKTSKIFTAQFAHSAAIALLAAASLTQPAGAEPAQNIYLKLEEITGAVTAVHHAGEIALIGFSTTLSTPTGVGQGGAGGVTGKPVGCGQFIVTKELDQASPKFFMDELTGRVIHAGRITFENVSGGQPFDFFTVSLTDVLIVGVAQSDPKGPLVTETVTLQAKTFLYKYTPQKADGTPGAPVSFGFDCSKNAGN